MPSEEEQERLRSLCGSDREDLEVTEGGELRLHADGPTVLTWNCRTSVGGGRGLRQCTVTSSQLGRACRVVRADSGGSLATRMVNAGGCLADALTPLVPLELREFSIGRDVSLRFRCPDPLELHECGIDVIANVGLDGIVGRLATLTANTDCEGPIPQSSIEIEFRLGLDGALRPRSEVQEGLREVARHVGDRLGCVVQERLAESGGIVDDSLTAAVDWLADVREKIESALGAARASFDCSAVLRERYRGSLEVPCDYYLDEDIAGHAILLRTPPQALVFRREIQLFEQTIHIEFVLAFGADVPALRVRCPSCGDRLDDLADSVARILAGMSADTLRYDGGATLHLVEEELRLRAPFEMELTFLDTSFSVVVTCSLDAREGDVFCDGQEPATLLSAAVVAAISRKIEDSGGRIAIPFGPFGAAVTEADSAGARIELSGDVSFPGVDEAVDLTVTLPLFGHAFDLEWDPNQLLGDLEEALLERVNGLFGSFVPIEITALDLVYDDVWPTGVRLSGAASIAELFTVSVPDVLLTDEGLSVDGPRELTIGFPAGLQLPVPPFTVCPTGGSLGPDRLVVVASVTVADCSADALLAVRGRGEVRLDTPGVFGVRGNLLLLRFLSLGNATAELNLPGRFLETELDIGGAIADVVRFRADMRVDGGDAPLGRARGELYLFRVPLSEQSVHVDLSRGGVEAEVGFDLFGVIVANGKFRMETFGRNPELGAKGAARVLGFTLASLGLQARPNYAKAGFRVLGLGLSVVVPGLDTLSPATLLEMIKNLLTPNFENLDEALLALLKGQIDLNPLADFGPGGDSALDGGDGDGDGAEGESPIDEGLGADDAAPGAVGEGDQSVAPAPSNAEEPTLLNPPGRFHIVIEPAGDDAWTIDLMEGDKHDTMIARVPGHLLTRPILRDGAGRPLVFNRHAYAHLADGRIAENATAVSGCQAGEVVPTVFTFVGIEAPRVGYFELCRLKTDDGSPVTPEALSDTAHGDLLRPFLTGLAAFPDSMPALWAQGEDSASNRPSRVLLSGWIGKIADDIRVAAGLAAPGRLLLVAEMPGAPDGATCTVTPDHSAAPSIRAFVLDAPDFSAPLDAAEVGKLEHVLRGLAACTGGSAALTRVSDEEQYLSAAGYLSRWSAGENGFVLVREPNELDEPVHTPAAPMELALLEALRADAPPLELVGSPPPSLEEIEEIAERSGTPEQRLALLDGGDSGTWIEIASEAGECVVRYAGAQRGRITGFPAGVFGGDCAPDGTVLGVGYADDTGDAGNPGRLMLVEMAQDRQAASLVHVGWGQAQRVELGAGWRTRQAFSVYRRAFRESLGSEPLALVETVKGFEEADGGAAWLYFASMEGDSPGWLIWAGRVGQGKLRLPAGIDDQQVNDLPRLIEVLATDAALPEAGEYGVAEWLVTGGHGLMLRTWEEYRMVPVVMWRASGNPGLLPGWQLAARLFERPAMRPGTSRDAARGMLDERLAGDPSAPTRAVWMFQYGEAMGLAFRGEGGPDEILWRYQQTEHGQSTAVQRVPQLLERAELDRLGAVDNWTFEGAANQEVLITAASGDFDTVVELWSPAGTFVACDDDSGESLNSQLKTRLPVAGRYDLLVYAYEDRHKGFYDVEVRGVEEAFTESGDDQCSRRGPGRGVEMLQEAFAQRSARVNGFFGLHTADACDGPASALVDRLQGGADPDNWVVRLESAECATGEVFLVEVTADGYDADSIRTVERFQGDAFALVSDIVGAPLPRNLFAAFRAEFLGDDVVQPLHLEGISVPLDDLGLGLAPAWAARMPRSDELVVLLMAGGDARRVIIHGVDDGSDSLAKLISFAVASPGDEFRARSVSNGGVMVEVRTTSGDHWLVVFDQDFEATHWVGVEGAALSGDRRRVDALALVLEAVSQLDGPAFRYDDGRGTPPRWDVAADDAALAVRPLTGGPYLLFGPVDDAEGWGTTVLCGAALPESLLLDLARRTGSHFGSSDANAATLAARLQGKVCSGAKPEVARFQPAPDSHDAGLLTSVDGDGRLVVATFTSCADGGDQGRCTLSPQRSEPEVPPALAERLLAMIGSEVGVGAAELRLVHDDGRRNAEDRRLLFAWKRDDRERMLFGMERNERPEICVPGASWVTLGRGEGEAPTLDSREVVEGLLAFFESRGCRTAAPEIVVFLYGEDVVVVFEDGGLMPAAALGGARLDRGEMTGAAVRYETAGARNGTWLLTARGISHTPAAAAQFPLQVRASAVSQRQARRLAWMVADSAPRARDGLPNGYRSLGGRTTWARSADFAQAQTGAAPSDDSVRIRVSFIPNGGRAALDVPVSLLDDGRAEIIYRAMIPYLMQTKRTLEVVRVGNERDLYRSLYDNNLTLVVDTAGEQPRIALLAIADDSRENVADWVLRAAVRAAAEPPPYGELAPAQELVGADRHWLMADRPVGSVRRLSQEQDAELLGTLPQFDPLRREAILRRVAESPKPFCALAVGTRAWLHFNTDEVKCAGLGRDGARRAWLVWSQGRWLAIETALEPGRVPIDTAIGILPAMSEPDAVFVQVTAHDDGRRKLLALMATCQGYSRERRSHLRKIYRIAEETAVSLPLTADEELAACLPRRDFDVLLDDLATEDPPGGLHLLEAAVPARHGGERHLLPVLYRGADKTVSRLGFRGRLIDLHLVRLGDSPDTSQAAVVEAETGGAAVSELWREAYLAFAAAAPAGPENGAPNAEHVLVVPPTEGAERGWLIVSGRETVEISGNAERESDDASRSGLAVPPDALSARARRQLVARLVAGLHSRLGSPGEKWPHKIAASGQVPFLAEVSRGRWIAVAEGIPEVAEVVASDFDGDAAIEPEGLLRGSLRGAFGHDWGEERAAGWEVHRVRETEGAIFGKSERDWPDGPFVAAGYWNANRKVFVQMDVERKRVAASRAGDVVAALRHVTEGEPPSVTEREPPSLLRLYGRDASLRLCSDLTEMFRVIQARGPVDVPGRQFDLEIWQGGERRDCKDGTIVGWAYLDDEVIRVIDVPQIESRVALVVSSEKRDRNHVLVGRSEPGGERDKTTLARVDGDEEVSTGCRSLLEGRGAAMLAETLMEMRDLSCAHAMEYDGDSEVSPAGAAIAGRRGRLVLAREGCRLELEPHEASDLDAEEALIYLDDFWDGHASSMRCRDGKGSWLVHGDVPFAIAESRLWRVKTNWEMDLTGGVDSRREDWLARWMASPYVLPGELEHDAARVLGEAGTIGEYLGIKVGDWSSTRTGRAPTVVLDSSTCLATLMVPGELDEAGSRWLYEVYTKRRMGVSTLPQDVSLREFEEGGRSAEGEQPLQPYVCDGVVVDLAVGNSPRTGVAQIATKRTCFISWLAGFRDSLAGEEPTEMEECIRGIDFWDAENSTGSLLVNREGDAEGDLEKRGSFLYDLLRDNGDMTARSASGFLANLGGGWEIDSWDIEPRSGWDKYSYFIVDDSSNGTPRFRTNVIYDACLEIKDDEDLEVTLTNKGFAPPEACGSGSNGLCAVQQLYQRLSPPTDELRRTFYREGGRLRPLWYRSIVQLFEDDPREAIKSVSISCE